MKTLQTITYFFIMVLILWIYNIYITEFQAVLEMQTQAFWFQKNKKQTVYLSESLQDLISCSFLFYLPVVYNLVLGTALSLLHGYSIRMLHWISTSKCPLQKAIMMSAELREPILITNSSVSIFVVTCLADCLHYDDSLQKSTVLYMTLTGKQGKRAVWLWG